MSFFDLFGEPDPLREAVRAELRGAPKPQNDKPRVYFMADGADASREFERVASGLRALSNSGVRMGHAPLPSPPIIECRYCGTQYHVGESRNCVNCGAPLPLR